MCVQEPNGADAAEWAPRPFRVQVKDAEGPAYWVTVSAIGPSNARGLAREKARDLGDLDPAVLRIEEVAA